jgi:polysaccharide export outer membrane protein
MGKLYRYFATSVAILCILLCGCETFKAVFDEKENVSSDVVATWWDGPRIRPGIALVVQVGSVAAPPVTMECLVDQNGDITLQHLLQGPVACDGLTLEALKQKLVKAYSVYYRQPQVTVTFAPYDGKGVSPWGTVTVLGEVGNPGPVNMPSTMDLTVTKVLQTAGGLKPFADRSGIIVTRCDKDGNQTRTRVDINEIGKDGRVDKDMTLRAGDVVWVPETWY